jgi:hypothetical protein
MSRGVAEHCGLRIADFVLALAAAFLRVRLLPRDFRALSSCLLGLFRDAIPSGSMKSAIRNPQSEILPAGLRILCWLWQLLFLECGFCPETFVLFRVVYWVLLGLFRESLFRLAASNPQSAIRNPKFFQPDCGCCVRAGSCFS